MECKDAWYGDDDDNEDQDEEEKDKDDLKYEDAEIVKREEQRR